MGEIKTEKTVADELREAATTLRDTAAKTTSGLWISGKPSWAGANAVLNSEGHPVTVCGEEVEGADHPASADAAWIALASPLLAEPLASWLEQYARWADDSIFVYDEETDTPVHESDYCDGEIGKGCKCFAHPMAVARVLNGTAP